MTPEVAPGCEAFSASGAPNGVLVLHGFTGSPFSMRPLAEVIANLGYAVELPRLPGHGTTIEDLLDKRWDDWSKTAQAAFDGLAARCACVALVGQSVGGGLCTWLAERHPEVAALVAINPLVTPIDDALRDGARELLAAGTETIDGVVNDIALPGGDEHGYHALPLAAALSLMDGLEGVAASLGDVTCPTLVFTSRQDHVVATENSELLASSVAGPVEHLWLEHSFHVATLDVDAPLIEAETCRFLETAFESA